MSRLYYGTYAHDDNEAAVTIDKQVSFNDAEQAVTVTQTWNIEGQVHGTTQNLTIAATTLLEIAYSEHYRDLVLYGDDGITVAHALRNAGSTTGVRITKPPSFPRGKDAELSTFRTYQITAQAEYYFNPRDLRQLIAFQESVSTRGGGPEFTMIATVLGPAVRQKVRNKSPFFATQQGSAIGRSRYPTPPGPIWPGFLLSNPQIVRTSPELKGFKYEGYGVQWAYEYGSPEVLPGLPNLWPKS